MSEFKRCLIRDMNMGQWALSAINERYEKVENEDDREYLFRQKVYVDNWLMAELKKAKRNCLYENHWGTCKVYCDCGCPDGGTQCTNQGD